MLTIYSFTVLAANIVDVLMQSNATKKCVRIKGYLEN
jgi:hypothetical protein